jgi:hypothetical protein
MAEVLAGSSKLSSSAECLCHLSSYPFDVEIAAPIQNFLECVYVFQDTFKLSEEVLSSCCDFYGDQLFSF